MLYLLSVLELERVTGQRWISVAKLAVHRLALAVRNHTVRRSHERAEQGLTDQEAQR
jgi:hypothetical protein